MACTISDRVPLRITGSICLKSPSNTIITYPPKILSYFECDLIISLSALSKASKKYLCAISTSSQIISCASFSSFVASDPCSMLQTKFSSVGIDILNFEWDVLPPANKRDVIPLDATVSTI